MTVTDPTLALGTSADRERSEIPAQYQWDIAALFKTEAEWLATFELVVAELGALKHGCDHLLDSAESLETGIDTVLAVSLKLSRLGSYANLSLATDTRSADAQARIGKLQALELKVGTATASYSGKLARLSEQQFGDFLAKRGSLQRYAGFISRYQRGQKHALSDEAAEVVAGAGQALDVADATYSALTGADLTFRGVTVGAESFTPTQGNIDALVSHPTRAVRLAAWESYADGYKSHENTITQTFLGSISTESFFTRLRKFPSSLEKKLFWDDLPRSVFSNTLQSFVAHHPTWHRYWRVRANALGLKQMAPCDVHAPLTDNAPPVSYAAAVEIISSAVGVMGEEYAAPIRAGLTTERWVDPFASRAKRGNAFSSGSYRGKPYILMNYNNSLSDVSTLAHELGHSIHTVLSNESQPIQDSGYSMFLAEIASNFCQVLVRREIFNRAVTADQKRAALDEAFYNLHRYLFTMPILSQFEEIVHARNMAGEGISAAYLSDTTNQLLEAAYGDAVELDKPRSGTMWAQYGHLYMSFYTFTYITGISIAHFYGNRVLAGDKTAVQQFLSVLRAGYSKFPLQLLRENGLDLLKDQPVNDAFRTLDCYIDQLEALR